MPDVDYGWKRFWVRREGSIPLENDGFLLDPEGPIGRFHPDVQPFEDLVQTPCLALLGEPGIGKSRALERELKRLRAAQGLGILYLDLRAYANEDRLLRNLFGSQEFTTWIRSESILEVFLDSLDECQIHLVSVAALLVDELGKLPTNHLRDRLRLRIACRTAEWPPLLEHGLPLLWGKDGFAAYELAPLRRLDVVSAAQAEGLDSEAFLQEVRRHEVGPLAAIPITLDMLLRAFHDSGQFPSARGDLYEKGCLALAQERSLNRNSSRATGVLSARDRLALATRIAAVTIFSKRSAVFLGIDKTQASSEDISLAEINDGEETVQGRSVPATEGNLKEALQTALFNGRGVERVGWNHWTYAEFLAARFLIDRGFTDGQIGDLLFHPESAERKKVIPQLHETAAWVASMNPRILSEIIAGDPAVLLRSSVTDTDAETRSRVVHSLLESFDAGELIDDISHRYDALSHSALADQLRPYIRDSNDVGTRRIAIRIAEACKEITLLSDLLDIVLNGEENHHIRSIASHAVARIGDPDSRRALIPLLTYRPEEDPDDQLRGNALRALIGIIPITEILAAITPPRQAHFFGAYQAFLHYELPLKLTTNDLPTALSWVATHQTENFDAELAKAILKLGSEQLSEARVYAAYVAAIQRLLPLGTWVLDPVMWAETRKRRDLLLQLIARDPGVIGSTSAQLSAAGLVVPEDFMWLLEQLEGAIGIQQEAAWAELASMMFDHRKFQDIELAFKEIAQSSELRARLSHWFSPWPLDFSEAGRMRGRPSSRREKDPELDPPLEAQIAGLLDQFEAGDMGAWWMANLDLTLTPRSTHYNGPEFESDLTSLPGWEAIDDTLRARCLAASEVYLRQADPNTKDWLGTNIFHRPAAAGYRALRLLLRLRPDRRASLPDSVWSTWAPIILAFPEMHADEARQDRRTLVAMAYARAPEMIIETVKLLLEKEDQQHGHLFVLDHLDGAWDERLVTALLDYARLSPGLKPSSLGDILKALLPRSPDVLDFSYFVLESIEDDDAREKAIEVGVVLLEGAPESAWPRVWQLVQGHPELGRRIFAQYAYRSRKGRGLGAQLSEDAIAALFIWLYEQFSDAERSLQITGVHRVTEEEAVANFRNALLASLRDRGTAAAVCALRRIGGKFPQLSGIEYYILEADRIRLQKTWNAISPTALLKMAGERKVRFVASEQQLLDVVIESLKRLDERLQGTPPAVRNLWNDAPKMPKDEAHLSNSIVLHLRDDLAGRGIVANREVEIRPGEETDIHITAVTRGSNTAEDTVSVILEAKGCWNRGLDVDMEKQLKGRYLKDNPTRHGIYVVGWFLCESWDKKEDYRYGDTRKLSLDVARARFDRQAADLSDSVSTLRAFVLNCTWR